MHIDPLSRSRKNQSSDAQYYTAARSIAVGGGYIVDMISPFCWNILTELSSHYANTAKEVHENLSSRVLHKIPIRFVTEFEWVNYFAKCLNSPISTQSS